MLVVKVHTYLHQQVTYVIKLFLQYSQECAIMNDTHHHRHSCYSGINFQEKQLNNFALSYFYMSALIYIIIHTY